MATGEKRITKAQREAFFATMAKTGIVNAACEISMLSRRTVERLRERDADWAADWEDAKATANDLIEAEIRRRAIHGVTRVAFGPRGIIIGRDGDTLEVTEYSDKLLEVLARGNMPYKYGELASQAIPALPADMLPDPEPTPDEPAPAKPAA